MPGGRFVEVGDELSMGGGIGRRLRDQDLPAEVLDVLDFCSDPGRLSIISLG